MENLTGPPSTVKSLCVRAIYSTFYVTVQGVMCVFIKSSTTSVPELLAALRFVHVLDPHPSKLG